MKYRVVVKIVRWLLVIPVLCAGHVACQVTFDAPVYSGSVGFSLDHDQILSTGDFNGDTYPDVVIEGQGQQIAVLLNDGLASPGTFTVGGLVVGFSGEKPVVADLNGDNADDIVVFTGNDIHYRLSDGSGGFAGPSTVVATYADPPKNIVAADFDGDGDRDIALLRGYGSVVEILENLQPLSTGLAPVLTIGTSSPQTGGRFWLAAGDYDGDGFSDVWTHTNSILLNTYGTTSIFGFNPVGAPASPGGPRSWITFGDFNGDCRDDHISTVNNQCCGQPSFGVRNSTSAAACNTPPFSLAFGALQTVYPNGPSGWGATAGDYDGDGQDELVVRLEGGGAYGRLEVFDFDATGTIVLPAQVLIPGGHNALQTADVDQDGRDDLLAGFGFSPTQIGFFKSIQTTFPVSHFECQVASTTIPVVTPGCEGWQSLAGTQVVMPNGLMQACASPGDGQWCEISPNTLGPASPAVTAPVPPTSSFVLGSVSRMQIATTAPTLIPGYQLRLEVKWSWLSGEQPASNAFNDFAQILVLPQPSGTPEPVMYVDTFSPLVTATNGCRSGVSNLIYQSGVSAAQTTVAALPPSLSGQPVIIDVIAANQGDNGFDSVLWIDEVNWRISTTSPLMAPSASALPLGPGCGSLLLTSTLPVVGSTATITVANAPASAISGYLFLGAPAAAPLSALPGCNVYLDLTPLPAFLPLSFHGGASVVPITVPASLDGWQVAMQAFEPTLLPLNLSNGLLLTIGP